MVAGAAAAEMTMSASAKLSYGNFGTGDYRSGYSAPTPGTFTEGATGYTADAATYDGSAGTSNTLTGDDLTAADTAYAAAMAVAGTTEAEGDAAGLAAGMLATHAQQRHQTQHGAAKLTLTLQVQVLVEHSAILRH